MEYIYGHRQNTIQVLSRLAYFLPVVEEKLDDIEVSAVRDYLGRTATTIFQLLEGSLIMKCTTACNSNGKGNTCSNVVEAEHRTENIRQHFEVSFAE